MGVKVDGGGGGGAATDATLTTSDITTNNVSTSKHGFAPKAPSDATKFLDGTGAYSTPPGGANTTLSNLGTTAINADLKTGAGTPLNLTAVPPASASASQAGKSVTITASDAVDGSSTHAAAAGGFVNIDAGTGANKSGNTGDGQVLIIGSGNTTMGANFIPLLGIGATADSLAQNGISSYNNNNGLVFGYNGFTHAILGGGLFLTSEAQIAFASSTTDPSAASARLSRGGVKWFQFGDPNDGGSTQDYILSGFNVASGTDTAGGKLTIRGGAATGAGAPGDLEIETAWPGTTGTTVQATFPTRYFIRGLPKTLTEGSATGVVDINIPSGSVVGGTLFFNVEANDGADWQARRGEVQFCAVNKGGTLTVSDNTAAGVPANLPNAAVSAVGSTLSVSFSITTGTNKITLNLNATSSLTQTVLRAGYSVSLDGGSGTAVPLS